MFKKNTMTDFPPASYWIKNYNMITDYRKKIGLLE